MPEQSIAKGNQILSDLINALGGPGYTEVRESQCEGRRVLFGHNGEPVGNIGFVDYRRYPDQDRTENISKGRHTILPYVIGIDGLDGSHGDIVIPLYNRAHVCTFDSSGVKQLLATS